MAEQKPNPLVGAVFGMVQDRQAAELAKVELLAQIERRLSSIEVRMAQLADLLVELVERGRR